MKKYMSVTVTISNSSSINGAFLYYSDDELKLEIATNISYKEGMEQLRKLEKRLGRLAKMTINQFDRSIAYKELHGYLDKD